MYTEKPDGSAGNEFIIIYEKETIILSALEGDDVTGRIYLQQSSGTGVCFVKEEFVSYEVMEKIKELGGRSTNDLPLLLLGALLLGSGAS